jgi:hypothetical protein
LTFALLSLTFFASTASADPNWPQWRGPDGQGVSVEKGLPTEWSATKNVKWKTPIEGRGHSSPIVWGKKIFLTTALDGKQIPGRPAGVTHKMSDGSDFVHPDALGADLTHTLKVICVDRATGKILWERVAYEGPVKDSRHKLASFASSTPATDGKFVFAFFGSEGLYAYDYNGKLVWKKSLGTLGTASVGYGVSPILYENLVLMQCDDSGGHSFIAAFDKKTGNEVWRAAREVDITLDHARAGPRSQPSRVSDGRGRGNHFLRSANRQGALAAQRPAEQCSSYASCVSRPRRREFRFSPESCARPQGRRQRRCHRHVSTRLVLQQGYRLCSLAHNVR